ncbi:MAG TPA: hypothetical protein VGN46_18190 [Luteibacter sp.]|jgi:hypothetical protein|uniref:hypothetical protein n=1 Tax=Luteibacter sp. TaxID=1886636 RepID=UPI002F42EF23
MSNVTEFLARVGQDAALRCGSPAAREALLTAMGIDDDATRAALAHGDAESLRVLLGGARFIATQMPDGPEREKEVPDEDEGDEDEGNDPLKKVPTDTPPGKGR